MMEKVITRAYRDNGGSQYPVRAHPLVRRMNVPYTYSLTFGEGAVNSNGMEQIGTVAEHGFQDFNELKKLLPGNVEVTELGPYLPVDIGKENASVVIIRNGVDLFLGQGAADAMLVEQRSLPFDKKTLMRGRVVNKRARWNSCYDDEGSPPDIASGKGTIIAFRDAPILNKFREIIPRYFGEMARNLKAEMNYYYDVDKCGVGYHGDSERKIVICVRLGASIPICYQWYYQGKRVGPRIRLELNHGDVYAMSEKAVGTDWRRRIVPTLRHAAGCKKYIEPKRKS